jgi:alkane 1-monooxygenase
LGKFKYIGTFLGPLLALITLHLSGVFAYIGIFVLYLLIPVLEIVLPKDNYNFTKTEKKLAKEDKFYDWILYLLVPFHLFVVFDFLTTVSNPEILLSDLIACVMMMGTLLGILGINGGHELGHKSDEPVKLFLAHVLLTTSMQNHFMTYHNSGHHRDVATPKDLTTAKRGDIFYIFAIRSQIGGYFKTWRLEAEKLKMKNKSQLLNPMIINTIVPWTFLGLIYFFFGAYVTLLYFIASIFGISILEAQNYFSHYGLKRKQKEDGTYERVKAEHSWNSDHLIGRVILFELARHSDHHYMGAKPYQLLESKEESPMLPYGYPAMLILSYFPFLFIPIMKKQLKCYKMA